MKVLVIAPYPVMPPDTGAKIRIHELTRSYLAGDMQVTVLMPMSPSLPKRKTVSPGWTLEVVPYPFILPYLFTDKPFSYMFLVSLHPGFRFLIGGLFKEYDIIQFEQASFGDLADLVPPEKVLIYDAHNVESDFVASENRPGWIRDLSYRRTFNFEKKLANRADQIFTCSADDSRKISRNYGIDENKCSVVPNGIHLDDRVSPISLDRARIEFPGFLDYRQRAVFSGSDSAHNREAVRFILDRVAPDLGHRCAFLIKGQCGKSFIKKKMDNVYFDLSPGDVGPYAEVCTVAVNPVMQGSGTSLKVLDYLKHGLPVVSTDFGMRGYGELAGLVILAAPESFAEALKQDHAYSPALAKEIKKYEWKSVCGRAARLCHQLKRKK